MFKNIVPAPAFQFRAESSFGLFVLKPYISIKADYNGLVQKKTISFTVENFTVNGKNYGNVFGEFLFSHNGNWLLTVYLNNGCVSASAENKVLTAFLAVVVPYFDSISLWQKCELRLAGNLHQNKIKEIEGLKNKIKELEKELENDGFTHTELLRYRDLEMGII